MSFLQPLLLIALPIAALPIVIHLINQRRYQTVRWAAMMFLLAASKMSRGYAKLRQWLILAMRVAAIAALVFAIGRPLAGGWLGLAAGGKADTTIVVLDRSPSMQQGATGGTKLETGRRKLAETFATLGSSRWVLIEGANARPREVETAAAIAEPTLSGPISAASDIPGLLGAARDYIAANKTGRTEVWICSDLREDDWNPDGGRWPALRDAFGEFPQGVRFHLLAYPETAPGNLAVRVIEARRQKAGDAAELLVSLKVSRDGGAGEKVVVPVRFEVDGARSEVNVELGAAQGELKDHKIPLAAGKEKGWGRVSIPADANLADNDAYFAYDQPAPRRALVVAEDAGCVPPLQLAASIPPGPDRPCSAEVVAADQLAGVDWESLSLLLWQGPLPEGDAAKLVKGFVDRGGYALFFPPRVPGGVEFLGAKWTNWAEADPAKAEAAVEGWRGDQDLLSQTQSGAALPVGQLEVRRSCGLVGEFTPLATLKGGAPLLARVATTRGGAYFCGTTPIPADSSLATGGVVLYVLVQRAMTAGASALGSTRQLVAGDPSGEDPGHWTKLAGTDEAISTDYPLHRGVYAAGDRLLAVNRPAAEDGAPVLVGERVDGLFRGLEFARVDDRAGSFGALTREVWRAFLVATMIALVVEAGLCLPKKAAAPANPSMSMSMSTNRSEPEPAGIAR